MSETAGTTDTNGTTGAATDEAGRFRVFTGFGLALAALLGGGVYASAFQWLAMNLFNEIESDRLYFTGFAASPLVMALVALGLAATSLDSPDPLVRPLARATGVVAGLAVVGAALLLAVTIDAP
jgi:hypothetical protein